MFFRKLTAPPVLRSCRASNIIVTARARMNVCRTCDLRAIAAYSTERPNTFLSRLLMRKRRAWTRDDLWALLSWFFVGQGAFILLGTTTFASLVLLLANSLQFHDWLARKFTTYLAKHTGLEVSFGDLIVPNWRTGSITLRNIGVQSIVDSEEERANSGHALYDLTLAKVDVRLSMKRMLEGKGLIVSCVVEGARGTIDRSLVRPDEDAGWRYKAQRGDFDLEGFILHDALINVISPPGFRSYNFSIISAELSRLRKRFLLYDLLAAESVVGMLDGSLFSMHIPQTHDLQRFPTMRHFKLHALNVDFFSHGADASAGPLSWLTRGSVDIDMFLRLPANHLANRDASLLGKIGFVTEGLLVEILRDSGATALIGSMQQEGGTTISLPVLKIPLNISVGEELKFLFNNSLSFLRRLQSRFAQDILNVDTRQLEEPEKAARYFLEAAPETVSFKVDLRFHNLRAHAPWSSTMRPLVAYINEQRPFIPLSCHFQIPYSQFEGTWTPYEAGLFEELWKETTRSFEVLVEDRQRRNKRFKKVSLWTLYSLFRSVKGWCAETGFLPQFHIE